MNELNPKNWRFPEEDTPQPYQHCHGCELSARNGGPCKVHDKYQRLPREKYMGALGQCMKIGGRGC